jgi:hypothetical protein
MKVKNEKPPVYDAVKKLLDFEDQHTIFTYGEYIYNPAGVALTLDLHAHEEVHMRQQMAMNVMGKLGPRRWWKRYLKDPQFRFEQELEAYRAQYQFAKRNIKDRNALHDYLVRVARTLASPMYGNLQIEGGLHGAMALIENETTHR